MNKSCGSVNLEAEAFEVTTERKAERDINC